MVREGFKVGKVGSDEAIEPENQKCHIISLPAIPRLVMVDVEDKDFFVKEVEGN